MRASLVVIALVLVVALGFWLGGAPAPVTPPDAGGGATAPAPVPTPAPAQGGNRTEVDAPTPPVATAPPPVTPAPPTPPVMAAEPNVRLTVRDMVSRQPVAAFRWRFQNSRVRSKGEGVDGKAALTLEASAVGTLLVEAEGLQPLTKDGVIVPTPPAPALALDLFLAPQGEATGITLMVHDLALQPLARVRVDAFRLADPQAADWHLGPALWARMAENTDGRYALPPLEPASYGLQVVAVDGNGEPLPLLPYRRVFEITGSNGFIDDVPLEPAARSLQVEAAGAAYLAVEAEHGRAGGDDAQVDPSQRVAVATRCPHRQQMRDEEARHGRQRVHETVRARVSPPKAATDAGPDRRVPVGPGAGEDRRHAAGDRGDEAAVALTALHQHALATAGSALLPLGAQALLLRRRQALEPLGRGGRGFGIDFARIGGFGGRAGQQCNGRRRGRGRGSRSPLAAAQDHGRGGRIVCGGGGGGAVSALPAGARRRHGRGLAGTPRRRAVPFARRRAAGRADRQRLARQRWRRRPVRARRRRSLALDDLASAVAPQRRRRQRGPRIVVVARRSHRSFRRIGVRTTPAPRPADPAMPARLRAKATGLGGHRAAPTLVACSRSPPHRARPAARRRTARSGGACCSRARRRRRWRPRNPGSQCSSDGSSATTSVRRVGSRTPGSPAFAPACSSPCSPSRRPGRRARRKPPVRRARS
jgi:hypothetical protein